MADTTAGSMIRPLSLTEELILMLLNEQNGYFHQVPGWELNCAVIGGVLADLSLQSRIDTDMVSLHLVDSTKTGNPALDPILKRIANESVQRNAQFWIERLAVQAESVIDLTLDRLVDLKILEHHEGEFWTLAPTKWHADLYGDTKEDTAGQFIKTRISEVIFTDTIPDPRDVIIICLVNTCDVFRFIFELDEAAEERIKFICGMDVIGRSISDAIEHNIANPLLRRSSLTKQIPTVSLHRLLLSPHVRSGNIPALFAELADKYGPVFEIRPPFKEPVTFLASTATNRWVHRHGRMYLRARIYFADFEQVYGASGVLPSLDGADHYRLRRAMSPAYSRRRLENQLDQVFHLARSFMANWTVGDSLPASRMCRRMINAQISPLSVSVDSQDLFDDLITYKERALNTHIVKVLPRARLRNHLGTGAASLPKAASRLEPRTLVGRGQPPRQGQALRRRRLSRAREQRAVHQHRHRAHHPQDRLLSLGNPELRATAPGRPRRDLLSLSAATAGPDAGQIVLRGFVIAGTSALMQTPVRPTSGRNPKP